ncbi:12705_t:CDS:2, partial [Cetraspora pellucida]
PNMQLIIAPPCEPSSDTTVTREREKIPIRITASDYHHNIIMDEYIRQPVTDHQLLSIGINTREYHAKARSFTEIQRILENALANKQLNLHIPNEMSRDTRFYPKRPERARSLQTVAKEQLNVEIAQGSKVLAQTAAKAIMRLYQKYEGWGYNFLPRRPK